MKTILNIGGTDYLLAKTTQPADLVKILELFQGARQVRHRTIYGPEGQYRYDDKYHRCVEVMDERPVKMRLEQMADEDVMTASDFEKLEKSIKAAIERDFPEKTLPDAAAVAPAA